MAKNKTIRILFFGDTNNNFLSLAMLLRRENLDAKVVPVLSIDRNAIYRVYDALKSKELVDCLALCRVQDLLVLEKPFEHESIRVRRSLESLLKGNCRVITVGSSLAPAMFEYAGLKLDITFATGSDVRLIPFVRVLREILHVFGLSMRKTFVRTLKENTAIRSKRDIWKIWEYPTATSLLIKKYRLIRSLPYLQYRGIQKSILVTQDKIYVDSWKDESSIQVKNLAIPMHDNRLYTHEIRCENSIKVFSTLAENLRSSYDFIILSTNANVVSKGTDILLRGYLKFRARNPSIKSLLILSARHDLAWVTRGYEHLFEDELHKKNIFLLPLVPQKELDVFYEISDVCFGKISKDNYFLNATICQILANGKPMLNFILNDYKLSLESVYPYLSVGDDEELSSGLKELYTNSSFRKKLGRESLAWYSEFTETAIKKWIKLFDEIK